jgi:hypothetical protein
MGQSNAAPDEICRFKGLDWTPVLLVTEGGQGDVTRIGRDTDVLTALLARSKPSRRVLCQAESIHQKVWESTAV